jgi:hypothetical protein
MQDAVPDFRISTVADPHSILDDVARLSLRCNYFPGEFERLTRPDSHTNPITVAWRARLAVSTWIVATNALSGQLIGYMSIKIGAGASRICVAAIGWMCTDPAWAERQLEAALIEYAATSVAPSCHELHYDAEIDMVLWRRLRKYGFGMQRAQTVVYAPKLNAYVDAALMYKRFVDSGIVEQMRALGLPVSHIEALVDTSDPVSQKHIEYDRRASAAEALIDDGITDAHEFLARFPDYLTHGGAVRTIIMVRQLHQGAIMIPCVQTPNLD